MAETVMQIEGLFYTYPDGKEALRGIDFQVEKGHKVFFHGANGAGKTTMFQCINGLLKIKRGTVRLHGKTVTKEAERMKQIGIVFQNAADQIVAGSVFDEIAFGPMNLGFSPERVVELVEESLKLLNIEHLRDRPPHFLSYGEKKRVCIASVLSMKQEIVILDEPTSGLDARQKEELVDTLNRLTNEGRTLLISTHDADFSFRCADRVIVLHEGRLLCEGKTEEIFSRSDVLEKAALVKPILMEVHEKLTEYSYLEPGAVPKNLEELSRLLQQKRSVT